MTYMAKRKHSGYSVGARWEATASNGVHVGVIWLESRTAIQGRPGVFAEVWKWSVCWDDVSGRRTDWGPTRRSVQEEARIWLDHVKQPDVRFKRVKSQN